MPGALGPADPLATDDAALRAIVEPLVLAAVGDSTKVTSEPVARIGLTGGDLCRTLGGRGDIDRLRTDAYVLPCDALVVEFNGMRLVAVAHVIARRSWWFGQLTAVMNATTFGSWDVAPRGHPGDGKVDIFDVTMSPRDRVSARRRLPLGTHVPHPDIVVSRRKEFDLSFDRTLAIRIDGAVEGRSQRVSGWVCPDAFEVVV